MIIYNIYMYCLYMAPVVARRQAEKRQVDAATLVFGPEAPGETETTLELRPWFQSFRVPAPSKNLGWVQI